MRIRLEYLFEKEDDLNRAEVEKIKRDLDSAAEKNEVAEIKWVGVSVFRED